MADFATTIRNKQSELIRKALDGSVFIAPVTADAIGTLTQDSVATPGTPEIKALPTGYDDLGWLTSDGARFSRDVSNSEVTSWGSVSPTRTDIVSDTSTLSVTAQETKLLTIGLATGADLTAIKAHAVTGEVGLSKPIRPKSQSYRVLSVAVDNGDFGEIYIARFLPRGKVTGFSEQTFAGGDEPITWGVTFTGEEDSTLGYSERWLFAGPGWKGILASMSIPNV